MRREGKLKQRRLGRTGLEISEIVFGGGWVGGILIDADDAVKLDALRIATEAGINWIDTAPMYGQGQSELALGRLLPQLPEALRPRLSTKVEIDLEGGEAMASQIERSLHESLERLNLERFELFQLHNRIGAERSGRQITVADMLGAGGVADVFDRFREQGLYDHIGITALGEGEALREVVASERFDTAQVHHNMINPSAGLPLDHPWASHDFRGLLDACHQHDVGVMNIRVYAAGLLATDMRTGREVPTTNDTDIALEERRAHAVLEAAGEGHGTRAEKSVRFALSNPHVSGVIVGLAEIEHLRQAVSAAEMGALPTDSLSRLAELYRAGLPN